MPANENNDLKADVIFAFNSLHFLPPNEVDEFLKITRGGLKVGGDLYGVANSIYSGNAFGNLETLFVKALEKNAARGDKFPGHLSNPMPCMFAGNYAAIEQYHLVDKNKFTVTRAPDNLRPNMNYPGDKSINRMTGSTKIDHTAFSVMHMFTTEVVENALLRAGFHKENIHVFYVDDETQEVVLDLSKRNPSRRLFVGFHAKK